MPRGRCRSRARRSSPASGRSAGSARRRTGKGIGLVRLDRLRAALDEHLPVRAGAGGSRGRASRLGDLRLAGDGRRARTERMPDRPGAPPRAWQRMLSGRRLDLLDPSPLDVEIEDIAHGLARVARWNGQTFGDHAFSVAQHSLLVERILRLQHAELRAARAAGDAAPRRAGICDRRPDLALQGGDRHGLSAGGGAAARRDPLALRAAGAAAADVADAHQEGGSGGRLFRGGAARRLHRRGGRALFGRPGGINVDAIADMLDAVAGEEGRIALSEGVQGRRQGRVGGAGMSAIVVCPLSRLAETVAAYRASHIVTLINDGTLFCAPARRAGGEPSSCRRSTTSPSRWTAWCCRRRSMCSDYPRLHAGRWDRAAPIVVHCFAGISRSTAAAFSVFCAARPDLDEAEIALRLRQRSPEATPNARLVAIADEILGRSGRMVRAIEKIGRGAEASKAPSSRFRLDE